MYSSGYSQVSKYSPQAQKKMAYRSKSKGCGYYMRIVFFFSSLIQSLIIVSLVLFLVYGKKQDSAANERIQDLEETFSRLSIENMELKQQRKNLTNFLNATVVQKTRCDFELARRRDIANISAIIIEDMGRKLQQCQNEFVLCKSTTRFNAPCQRTMTIQEGCNCGLQVERLVVRLEVVESNFSRTVERMRMEADQVARERDNNNLDAIRARREKDALERELQHYRQRCKEDFSQSLSGITNVSRAFLLKIETLFPTHLSFQLTCDKQQEHLEQIRSNCTNLSRDVEDRFQRYLNNVGDQVSHIQRENSRLKTENGLLNEDYRKCSQNRTGMIREHAIRVNQLQLKHDKETERLLLEKIKLSGELEVMNKTVKYKGMEVEHLSERVRQLNSTCIVRNPFASEPGYRQSSSWNFGLNSGGSTYNRPATGYGSAGSNTGLGAGVSPYNKPATGGVGSTGYGSTMGLGAGGSTYNKPATGGVGSTGYGSTGSNTGLGAGGSTYNKPATGGVGSTGYGSAGSNTGLGAGGSTYNKPATGGSGSTGSYGSTGSGTSRSGSGVGSTGSSYGSTGSGTNRQGTGATGSSSASAGSGVNKPSSGATGSSSYGSTGSSSSGTSVSKPATTGRGTSTGQSPASAGSTGSGGTGSGGTGAAKPASSGSSASTGKSFGSWWGLGSSSSSSSTQSKAGGTTGSTAGRGTSSGSPLGTGRTSGVVGGTYNVAEHLQALRRIVDPSAAEEKQELPSIMG